MLGEGNPFPGGKGLFFPQTPIFPKRPFLGGRAELSFPERSPEAGFRAGAANEAGIRAEEEEVFSWPVCMSRW